MELRNKENIKNEKLMSAVFSQQCDHPTNQIFFKENVEEYLAKVTYIYSHCF